MQSGGWRRKTGGPSEAMSTSPEQTQTLRSTGSSRSPESRCGLQVTRASPCGHREFASSCVGAITCRSLKTIIIHEELYHTVPSKGTGPRSFKQPERKGKDRAEALSMTGIRRQGPWTALGSASQLTPAREDLTSIIEKVVFNKRHSIVLLSPDQSGRSRPPLLAGESEGKIWG